MQTIRNKTALGLSSYELQDSTIRVQGQFRFNGSEFDSTISLSKLDPAPDRIRLGRFKRIFLWLDLALLVALVLLSLRFYAEYRIQFLVGYAVTALFFAQNILAKRERYFRFKYKSGSGAFLILDSPENSAFIQALEAAIQKADA